MRSTNWRIWFGLMPALTIMIFVGVVPLSIVFHHSFYDIFTLESKFWVGGEWYVEILTSLRFYESLGRSFAFSLITMWIQFPLGILIALAIPKIGPLKSVTLVLLALPLVVPWNMIPAI